MANQRDFYEVLGVSKNSTDTQIKSAYRKLALQYHPDRNKEAGAEEKFKEVTKAYEVLSDPQKKAQYDRFGHAAFDQNQGYNAGNNPFNRSGPFGYSANVNFEDIFGGFSDPMDIFENFFGGASPFQRGPQKITYQIVIPFMEAAKGVTKTLVHQGKQYQVKVPAGVDSNTKIRFGDFDLIIQVQQDPHFQREGQNLIYTHSLGFVTAILGGEVTIPTLDGDVNIKIKPGTQPDSLLRLTGKGLPSVHGNGKGDLYIRFKVTIPSKITKSQKQILEKYESA